MIGGYGQDEHIAPCPLCLRDTMLNVAALLHVEAAKLYAARPEEPPADGADTKKSAPQSKNEK